MSDIGNNIRRIAQTKELKELIDQLLKGQTVTDRGNVDKTISTAFGSIEIGGYGAGGGDQKANTQSASPSDANSNSAGSYSITDVLAGEVPIGMPLNEIEGMVDCATGDKLNLITTDFYPVPKGVDEDGNETDEGGNPTSPYVPAWTTPDSPPVAEDWTQGEYATATGIYPSQSVAAGSATAVGILSANAIIGNSVPAFGASATITGVRDVVLNVGSTTASFEYYISGSDNPVNDGWVVSQVNITSGITCGGSETGDAGTACALTSAPALTDQWPSDGEVNLSFDGARFNVNSFDPDVTAKYVNGVPKLNACTAGGDNVSIQPLSDGGFAIYETDTLGGAVSADTAVQVYGTDINTGVYTLKSSITDPAEIDLLKPK